MQCQEKKKKSQESVKVLTKCLFRFVFRGAVVATLLKMSKEKQLQSLNQKMKSLTAA